MTTLRYTPDKPYKVQINAVNSKVDIFGVTDDLYYIRYNRNFGFLPKNHLRESSKGNFLFDVEVDISKYRIDQSVREENFLSKFLEASQTPPPSSEQPNSERPAQNDSQPAPVHEEVEESAPKEPDAVVKPQEVVPSKPDVDTAETTEKPAAVVESAESENDSGIEDEGEDDDEEDDEEESDEDVPSVLDSASQEQPELVAIPPGRNTELPTEKPEVEPIKLDQAEPPAVPVAASASVESPQFPQQVYDDAENATVEEKPKTDEIVPEFIPIQPFTIEKADNFLNETVQASPEADATATVQQAERAEEVLSNTPAPAAEHKPVETAPEKEHADHHHDHDHSHDHPQATTTEETVTEKVLDQPTETVVEQATEKAQDPVNESPELPIVENTEKPQLLFPDVPVESETLEPPIEAKAEEPADIKVDEPLLPPPTIETTPKDLPPSEPPQPDIQEQIPLPPQQPKVNLKPDPDALMQKFNEKLGNRVMEGTGKGSVEPLHKDDHSHQHHGHEHSHHDHGHAHHDHGHAHHDHAHNERIPESQEPQPAEEEQAPGFFSGFFSGLSKRFFSDKDDSEQHFHDKAQVDSSTEKPATDDKGELMQN